MFTPDGINVVIAIASVIAAIVLFLWGKSLFQTRKDRSRYEFVEYVLAVLIIVVIHGLYWSMTFGLF